MEGLSGLDILDAIKGYKRIILVDAIKAGGEPGTIYKLSLRDFKDKHTIHSFSTHLNMDLPTMLELGKQALPGENSEGYHDYCSRGRRCNNDFRQMHTKG